MKLLAIKHWWNRSAYLERLSIISQRRRRMAGATLWFIDRTADIGWGLNNHVNIVDTILDDVTTTLIATFKIKIDFLLYTLIVCSKSSLVWVEGGRGVLQTSGRRQVYARRAGHSIWMIKLYVGIVHSTERYAYVATNGRLSRRHRCVVYMQCRYVIIKYKWMTSLSFMRAHWVHKGRQVDTFLSPSKQLPAYINQLILI